MSPPVRCHRKKLLLGDALERMANACERTCVREAFAGVVVRGISRGRAGSCAEGGAGPWERQGAGGRGVPWIERRIGAPQLLRIPPQVDPRACRPFLPRAPCLIWDDLARAPKQDLAAEVGGVLFALAEDDGQDPDDPKLACR